MFETPEKSEPQLQGELDDPGVVHHGGAGLVAIEIQRTLTVGDVEGRPELEDSHENRSAQSRGTPVVGIGPSWRRSHRLHWAGPQLGLSRRG